MLLQYSSLESNRFGMRVLRGSLSKIEPYELLRTIVEERADVAIIRLPSSQQHQLEQLSMLPFPVIVADTLVSFDCDLREFPPAPLHNPRLVVKHATPEDAADLKELVDLSFKEYRTHYNSNPLFDPQLVLAGYKEWAMSALNAGDKKVCFLFYLDGQAIGYATSEVHEAYGDGIIFGARPRIAVKNLYVDMLNYTKQYMWDQGRFKVRATTQVQNTGVQRAWVRMGFAPSRAHCTVHINALLNQKLTAAAASPPTEAQ